MLTHGAGFWDFKKHFASQELLLDNVLLSLHSKLFTNKGNT
ncbi:hypothetical protein OMAG_001889 [Candidatus Omnitrophus magneticus]|uniref:Uncharacterized protein n=1 Tax=Candidatus Omnitrophus magneticus TaxID=1609969 RepID=A0A0F0CRX0_9BACT|nr:hypothetical protein OMAG_001889 [Candidatus Omnitrophus magneticus]